jgi:hypothetical protein
MVANAPTGALLGPITILAGISVLVWDYAILPATPLDHVAYWIALGLAYAGVVLVGATGRPSLPRQLAALAALGVVTWLPTFLRSPDRSIFVDELLHRDILTRILETGHAYNLPITLFPLPGTFPGLESAATAVIGWTGLPMDLAMRALTLTIHALIPPLAYLAARGVGLPGLMAFLAALVYAANTSFAFFHSVFSYESLGIVLFLSVWALLALRNGGRSETALDDVERRDTRASPLEDTTAETATGRRIAGDLDRRLLTVLAVLIVALAVTHHVSSYVLAATLVVAWIAGPRASAALRRRTIGVAAGIAVAAALGWFLVTADRVEPYLANGLAARFDTIVRTLLVEHSQPRALFTNADQPALERLLAFSYPPLVLFLSALGLWFAWRRGARPALWVALALIGPVGWFVTTPAVITRSGELAYRAWPFLFLGVAVFAAISLVVVGVWIDRRSPGAGHPVMFALVGCLLFGGISIGENQAGRFPSSPTTAAGGATDTPDVGAAAAWLLANAGPGHLIATDVGTAAVFGTDGRQRILPWQSWYPFVADDPDEISRFLIETDTEYVVVDQRITQLPPRYGSYFGAPSIPDELDPGVPFDSERLDALEATPGLHRIFDGPNLSIYQATPPDQAIGR